MAPALDQAVESAAALIATSFGRTTGLLPLMGETTTHRALLASPCCGLSAAHTHGGCCCCR
ncbi:Hypothetical protein SynRCC307_1530 [Synechococcus sp. RCC307]|nr:Hypothetical protein SynRCC307_1530 [Synechococcus sp. RCC307]